MSHVLSFLLLSSQTIGIIVPSSVSILYYHTESNRIITSTKLYPSALAIGRTSLLFIVVFREEPHAEKIERIADRSDNISLVCDHPLLLFD